ncbi:MAG: hypothetical protein EXS05_06585 [Planctomycetaceae bacterium]|nr:hypothetical protein [Planctomycetaceae bacterium]
MNPPESSSRLENSRIVLCAASCVCLLMLISIMRANFVIYGNAYVFNRQLIVAGVLLFAGALAIARAVWLRRWKRCAMVTLVTAGLMCGAWWLVPDSAGYNLIQLQNLARQHASSLRALPVDRIHEYRAGIATRP